MTLDINKVKQIREETGAGVVDAKKALEESGWDYVKALEYLAKNFVLKAQKKSDREAQEGLIHSYIHFSGKVGSLIHLCCETDFVAKNEAFKKLANEVAMQICTDDYTDLESLLKSEYVREPNKSINDLIKDLSGKLGERIELKKFVKYSIK